MELNSGSQIFKQHLSEVFILLAVPVILIAIYYLTSMSFQQLLTLDHTDPAFYAFWTNALVHKHGPGDSHLLGNIISYLILIFPCWMLYIERNEKRIFWSGFLIIFAISPLVVSASSYITFNELLGLQIENDRGFSGVVGAIIGFLIMTIIRTFAQEQKEKVAVLSMGLYFGYLMIGLGAVTVRIPFIVIGALTIVLIFVSTWTPYLAPAEELAAWGQDNPYLSLLLVVAVLVSAFAFATVFPTDITNGSGGLTNIVAHGAGVLFGMAVEISLFSATVLPIRRAHRSSDR